MQALSGERIQLRPVEIEDLDVIYQWENNPQNWRVSNFVNPVSRFFLEQYILTSQNNIYADHQLRLMIVDYQNKPLGIIDLFDFDPHHRRAGVGILLGPGEGKKGYATEALKLVINYARKKLNLKQLYCGIDPFNEDSVYLFRKQGFQITGQKKAWRLIEDSWHDEYFLQLILKEE